MGSESPNLLEVVVDESFRMLSSTGALSYSFRSSIRVEVYRESSIMTLPEST